MVEPLRYALALRPRFIALEQVPPVLDYWRHIARILEGEGYGCWAGILECERYGVPQTRERAILMAEFDGQPHPPSPTHQRYVPGEPAVHELTFDGELLPWVSMAEALGWGMTERPAVTIASANSAGGGPRPLDGGSGAREILRRERDAGRYEVNTGRDWKPDGDRAGAQTRPLDEPAPSVDSKGRWHIWPRDGVAATVNGDPRISRPGHHSPDESGSQQRDAITVTEHEAGVLQGFAADHPWQGNKSQRFQQIGNAIPPPLARAILEALLSPVREGRIAA